MKPRKLHRRLTTILATDVVGYSRLMREDEELTLAALHDCRAIVEEEVVKHGGRIFHIAADALLAEFDSPVEAVRCGVAFQRSLALRNREADTAMEFRVGINLGDVMVDGDDLLGDGVNIAARLEGIAEPGGICISASVYEHIRNKLALDFGAMGGQLLKNIAEPVAAYKVNIDGLNCSVNDAAESEPVAGAPGSGDRSKWVRSEPPAVAVLPFDTFSADPEHCAFADGLTEDLITALATFRSFPVIARNSTFAYKGTSPDIRKAAGELGARYVVEGSVRMGAGRIRVNVQLIDALDGHHLWAQKLDRDLDEIFEVQDAVTEHIAAIVDPELTKAEWRRVQKSHPESLDAWSLCQRGYAELERYTPQGNRDARSCFERAIELDPGFARAWVALAYSHHRDIMLECCADRAETLDAELVAARRAVALDDSDSMAHAALGGAYLWGGQLDDAIAEGRRALELNPSNVVASAMVATALSFTGRPDESFAHFDKALKLNPQDTRNHVILTLYARAHLNARNPEAAIGWAKQATRKRENYTLSYLVLASACGHMGMTAEGAAALNRCTELDPEFAIRWSGTRMYRNEEDDIYFIAGLEAVGFRRDSPQMQ